MAETKADRALHALGNGETIAYGRGIEWVQVFGPPYSSPTMFSLIAEEGGAPRCESRRLPGSNLWEHRLPQGEIADCAARHPVCLLWILVVNRGHGIVCHTTDRSGYAAHQPKANTQA